MHRRGIDYWCAAISIQDVVGPLGVRHTARVSGLLPIGCVSTDEQDLTAQRCDGLGVEPARICVADTRGNPLRHDRNLEPPRV
jgi:hypothetical protein